MTGDTRHHYGTWGQLGQESWIVTRSWRSEECANAPSIKAKPTMPPHTSPQPAAAASHIAFKFPWPIIRIHTIQLILDMSSTMRHYSMPCPTSMADQYIGPFMQSNKTNLERVQRSQCESMWITGCPWLHALICSRSSPSMPSNLVATSVLKMRCKHAQLRMQDLWRNSSRHTRCASKLCLLRSISMLINVELRLTRTKHNSYVIWYSTIPFCQVTLAKPFALEAALSVRFIAFSRSSELPPITFLQSCCDVEWNRRNTEKWTKKNKKCQKMVQCTGFDSWLPRRISNETAVSSTRPVHFCSLVRAASTFCTWKEALSNVCAPRACNCIADGARSSRSAVHQAMIGPVKHDWS